MGQTSSIIMPSMVGIVGCVPAVDEKCYVFLFVTLWNYEVCDNRKAMKQCNFQNSLVSLHRFVVVHLYSSLPLDPQNFPRVANFYQKLPILAIFGTVRPHF